MSLSVLEICQEAAIDLSLVVPTTTDTTLGDPTTNKLVRQLHRTCRQLAARYDWQKLRREKTFTSSAAAAQSGAVAADLLRFIPNTFYNRDQRRRVRGPVTASEWQNVQASYTSLVQEHFTQRGNSILITPTPAGSETMAYEYITNYIGTDSTAATERAKFSTDDDLTYFDDELVIMGIVWRYRKAEGHDYAEEFRDYEMRLADMLKQDGGRRIQDMNDPGIDRTPTVNGGDTDYLVTV